MFLEEGHPFIYISDRFLAILGWTREEIKTEFHNKFDNMLHPDDRHLSAKYTARILDTCDMDLHRIRFTGCLERMAIIGSQMPQHW